MSVVAYIDTYIFTKEYEKCTESRNIANALRSNSYLTLILFRLHNYLISYLATGNVIYLFLHSLIWFNFLFQVTIVSLTVGEHYYKLSLRKMSSEFIIADHSFFKRKVKKKALFVILWTWKHCLIAKNDKCTCLHFLKWW